MVCHVPTPTPARMALPTTDYARKVGDKQEEKNLKEEKRSPEKYFTLLLLNKSALHYVIEGS
jgi:hypothetical protein